jgi:hypothetical protein
MKQIKFNTTILAFGNNTGIEVPERLLKELSASKKPAVKVSIGMYSYESTIAVMKGQYLLSLSKSHREKSGLQAGDVIEVLLSLLEGPREVEIPIYFKNYLEQHGLTDVFMAKSFSFRKEAVRKVVESKKEETRLKNLFALKQTLTS